MKHARALIARAWRARAKALESPPTDEAALRDVMARVEADLARACEICARAGAEEGAFRRTGQAGTRRSRPGRIRTRARTLFAESVAVAREADDPLRLAHALRHLGQVEQSVGPA